MTFLLDTDVVSELRRPSPSPAVVAWVGAADRSAMMLSALTVGELRRGVESLRPRDPLAASHLDDWLDSVTAEFDARVLPVDARVAHRWGRLSAELAHHPVGVIDGLIAATALVHGLTVVTRNVRHFAPTGVPLIDPFAAG